MRNQYRFFGVPLKFTTEKNYETKPGEVWVGGLYDGVADKRGNRAITIQLQYHPDDKKVHLSRNKFYRIARLVADTTLHEVIHARQYRRRKYKEIPGYTSTAELRKQRNEQTYLGHNDEIDAYSFNIACQLSDMFLGNKKEIINYLNSDLKDKRLRKTSYKMYLDAFNHNHSHTVIKKLKKKIIYYLSYVEIGKPYKTSDWLK